MDAGGYTVLRVYAQAGETIQMGSSSMNLAGGTGNILLYPRGMSFDSVTRAGDPATYPAAGTEAFNCATQASGTGRIGSRAQELAGPAPIGGDADPATWTPCEYVVPAGGDGIYSIIMRATATGTTPAAGSIANPRVTITPGPTDQGPLSSIWDVTVRDTGGAVRQGRLFTNSLYTGSFQEFPGSNVNAFLYTKTGYEYNVGFQGHAGAVWRMASDDRGVVNVSTGDPLYASFDYLTSVPQPGLPADAPLTTRGDDWLDTRHPIFFNQPSADDMLAITGPGGLAEVRGFSATAIAPGTNPFSVGFTGSEGQSAATNYRAGGSIAFSSPRAMEGLRYRLLLDLNNDGTFGNAADVTTSGDLSSAGNSFAWDGRDAAGNTPACGTYPYRVQAALAEIHLTQDDAETSAGTTLERLTRADDPALPGPFLLSYNDIDAFTGDPVTNSSPLVVPDPGQSSEAPGFHAYTAIDMTWIEQWARLPEVSTTGTFEVLCPRMTFDKDVSDNRVRLGDSLTYTLTARNNGPGPSEGTKVSDPVPSHIDVRDVDTTKGSCSTSGNRVECDLGVLAEGEEVKVTIRGVAVRPGTARNVATFEEPLCTPEKCPQPPPVRTRIPKLKLTKVVGKRVLRPGQTTTYKIRVSNVSSVGARNVRTCDRLPAGLVFVSSKPKAKLSRGQHCWTAKRIAARKSKVYRVTVRVLPGASGRLVNTATTSSPDTRGTLRAKRRVRVIGDPPVSPPPTG